MRDCSKRWKNTDFPHIPYYHIPEHFTKKTPLQVIFFKNFVFWCFRRFFLYTRPFVEYEDLCVCLIDPVECEGVRWSAPSAVECDATWVCVFGNPLGEGFWAPIPQILEYLFKNWQWFIHNIPRKCPKVTKFKNIALIQKLDSGSVTKFPIQWPVLVFLQGAKCAFQKHLASYACNPGEECFQTKQQAVKAILFWFQPTFHVKIKCLF